MTHSSMKPAPPCKRTLRYSLRILHCHHIKKVKGHLFFLDQFQSYDMQYYIDANYEVQMSTSPSLSVYLLHQDRKRNNWDLWNVTDNVKSPSIPNIMSINQLENIILT